MDSSIHVWLCHAVMASVVELDHPLATYCGSELRIHVCPPSFQFDVDASMIRSSRAETAFRSQAVSRCGASAGRQREVAPNGANDRLGCSLQTRRRMAICGGAAQHHGEHLPVLNDIGSDFDPEIRADGIADCDPTLRPYLAFDNRGDRGRKDGVAIPTLGIGHPVRIIQARQLSKDLVPEGHLFGAVAALSIPIKHEEVRYLQKAEDCAHPIQESLATDGNDSEGLGLYLIPALHSRESGLQERLVFFTLDDYDEIRKQGLVHVWVHQSHQSWPQARPGERTPALMDLLKALSHLVEVGAVDSYVHAILGRSLLNPPKTVERSDVYEDWRVRAGEHSDLACGICCQIFKGSCDKARLRRVLKQFRFFDGEEEPAGRGSYCPLVQGRGSRSFDFGQGL